MVEHSPNAMQDVSDGHRTVLPALGYAVKPVKDSVYDHARRSGLSDEEQ